MNLRNGEVAEAKLPEVNDYREIKPVQGESVDDARNFLNDLHHDKLDQKIQNVGEIKNDDNPEKDLEKVIQDYFKDIKNKSDCPETIEDKPFEISDLRKRTPEENAEKRVEFVNAKAQLKKDWEKLNGRPWPKYEEDVYSSSGRLIRKAGSDYDAHHIQPLCLGGENVADNITPLRADVHYDHQGVHAFDSPYQKMNDILGGTEK